MKITVNRSAKNSARCQRSRAIVNLITEHDGLSCYISILIWYFALCNVILILSYCVCIIPLPKSIKLFKNYSLLQLDKQACSAIHAVNLRNLLGAESRTQVMFTFSRFTSNKICNYKFVYRNQLTSF